MNTPTFTLSRDSFGHLVLHLADGEAHSPVVPVRAFPLAAPDEHISLVSSDGAERLSVERLSDLPASARILIEDELANRDFIPVIQRLKSVSTFATPSTWFVTTDRGETRFVLRGEEDIRRLPSGELLIADSHGIHYRIAEVKQLDKASRRLLDRFL